MTVGKITDHTKVNYHRYTTGKAANLEYRFCGVEEETTFVTQVLWDTKW